MIYVCELLTEEPEGGSAMIPLPMFIHLYQYLAELDCSGRYSYIEEKLEPFLPCVCSDFKTPELSLEPSVEVLKPSSFLSSFFFPPRRIGNKRKKKRRNDHSNDAFRKKREEKEEYPVMVVVQRLTAICTRLSMDRARLMGREREQS